MAGPLSLQPGQRRRLHSRRRPQRQHPLSARRALRHPRLGYSQLPAFEQRLAARGYSIAAQARDSERLLSLADEGLFLPYDEKDQAGLTLRDASGAPIYDATFPHRVYTDFDAIPPLVVRSLLFIEDRYLLDPDAPNRNPAIDWRRFGRARCPTRRYAS